MIFFKSFFTTMWDHQCHVKERSHTFNIQGYHSALTFSQTNHFIVCFLHQDQSFALHQSRPTKPFQPCLETSHFPISFSPVRPMTLDIESMEYTNMTFYQQYFTCSNPSICNSVKMSHILLFPIYNPRELKTQQQQDAGLGVGRWKCIQAASCLK